MRPLSRLSVAFCAACLGTLTACATGPAPQGMAPAASVAQQESVRQLTRRVTMKLTVEHPDTTSEHIQSIVGGVDGSVEALRVTSGNQTFLELRVPAPRLDRVLGDLRNLGRVDHESMIVADVTDEIGDLDARLQNLVAVRGRLRGYLERAESIEDIVSVERELTRVQIEIDRITAVLDRLRGDVAMSHVSLELSRKRTLGPLGAVGVGLAWVFKKLVFIN